MTEIAYEELLYIVENLGNTPGIITVLAEGDKPTPNPATDVVGRLCIVVATGTVYRDTGADWQPIVSSAVFSGTSYRGTWDASTNTPTLTSSTGTAGYYYLVTTAGTTTLDGIASWAAGDWAVYNGTVWQKAAGIHPLGTEGTPGILELATSAETTTGTDTTRAVHPAGLKGELDKKPNILDVVSSVDGVSGDGGDIALIEGANFSIISDNIAKTITLGTTSLPSPFGSGSEGFWMLTEIAVDGAGLDASGAWIDDAYIGGGHAGHTPSGFWFEM